MTGFKLQDVDGGARGNLKGQQWISDTSRMRSHDASKKVRMSEKFRTTREKNVVMIHSMWSLSEYFDAASKVDFDDRERASLRLALQQRDARVQPRTTRTNSQHHVPACIESRTRNKRTFHRRTLISARSISHSLLSLSLHSLCKRWSNSRA